MRRVRDWSVRAKVVLMVPLTVAISMPLILLVFWLLSIPVNAALVIGVFAGALGFAIHVALLARKS